jgi:hypothetical protein
MKSHLAFSCVLTLGLLTCASSVPSLNEYRDGLSLGATVSRSEVAIGEPLDFTLTLTNTSAQSLEACLGETKTYHIFGTKRDDGQAGMIDHESCVRRFRLDPGQHLVWTDSIRVGDVGPGPAKFFTSVSIVALQGCSRDYGCYHTSVSSHFVPLEIVSREPQEAK